MDEKDFTDSLGTISDQLHCLATEHGPPDPTLRLAADLVWRVRKWMKEGKSLPTDGMVAEARKVLEE